MTPELLQQANAAYTSIGQVSSILAAIPTEFPAVMDIQATINLLEDIKALNPEAYADPRIYEVITTETMALATNMQAGLAALHATLTTEFESIGEGGE